MEQSKYQRQYVNDVESGFKKMFVSIGTGMASFSQGIRGLFLSMGDALVGVFADIAAKWVANQIMMRLFGQTTAAKNIAASAAEAGAAGTASFAAAPWPIDMGAPAFGAEMAMAAGAYSGAISLDTGMWQVPRDMLANIHKDETVLPKHEAEQFRSGGQGGSSGSHKITINAVDAAGVKRLFMEHGPALVDSLLKQSRNFNGVKR